MSITYRARKPQIVLGVCSASRYRDCTELAPAELPIMQQYAAGQGTDQRCADFAFLDAIGCSRTRFVVVFDKADVALLKRQRRQQAMKITKIERKYKDIVMRVAQFWD